MNQLTNTIQNNILELLGAKAPKGVINAIQKASAKTGVNFAYMVQQAGAESSFNPTAKAKTSSASGLYQFIESTWMGMIGKYGEKYGIETEGKTKQEILALRNDAEISANMAAEFASENERYLDNNWGGDVGPTELYFAHFMGAGGATAFLKAKDENALQPAADLFPRAARANRNVFFDQSGRAKSLDEVYAFFDKKFSIKEFDLPALEEDTGQNLVADASADNTAESDVSNEASVIASSIFVAGTNRNNIPAPPRLKALSAHNNAQANSLWGGAAQKVLARQANAQTQTGQIGQIPSGYQNLLRSPIDLMLMSQLDTNKFFQKS